MTTSKSQPQMVSVQSDDEVDFCWCGGEMSVSLTVTHSIYVGGGESIEIELPYVGCTDCDNSRKSPEAQKIKHDAVSSYLNILNSDEIRKLPEVTGIPVEKFEETFGISPTWLNDLMECRFHQNKAMDTLLRALMNPVVVQEIKARKA
jgi:hypothetical protein